MNKWGKKYWADLAERVGASATGGVLAMVTADATGVADYSPKAWWVMVGIPAATAALKGLLVNFGGSEPTASIADVTSGGEAQTVPVVNPAEGV